MKLESPVVDLEPHEWRRIVKWFYKPGWPPWDWRPFVFLYVLLPSLAVASIADFLRYLGF
jgi:hypothetical protein